MSAGFVHLRLHTEYSLVDSVVRVPELVEAVAAAEMPAVALTDQMNLFAMVKLYRAALERGIKPIVGVDLLIREPGERAQPSRLSLLCQSETGYRNVTRLLSRAYLEGQQRGVALVDRRWLSAESLTGLIALSGAAEGDIGRALLNGHEDEAARACACWRALFPERFYLELQRIGRLREEEYIAAAVALAARLALPVVATNDVRFLRTEDFESHEARVCIHEGSLLADPARVRRYTPQQYLRTPREMAVLFADVPEALANSVEIARRASLVLRLGEIHMPQFPVPEGTSDADFLRREAARGLQRRLAAERDAERIAQREARLTSELDVICQMGFAGYFLIVADFIRWARENSVPVGPGRGSGAGSLVAYCLGITDLDPLDYELLFERFLNPERVSLPDFDVDFCVAGRDRVIDYVADKYGRDRVSQIITYGTLAAKAVVRDAGRVLGMSYGFVDRIAKLVPFELEITLNDALEKEPELARLYHAEDEVRNLIDLARSLEGLTRNAGTHAGGVVIAPSPLTDFTPLYCEEGATSVVTQFDKDDLEASGLVKFDFLGLRTLTIIDRTVRTINPARAAGGAAPLDITALPLNDAPTYTLIKSGRTTAIFQLESRGLKDLIRRLQPDHFEDIVALVALYRPGPLQSGMVEDFIERKHSPSNTPIDYLHPALKSVLAPTYGVILYQEQVMQIAQVLAGYTLGGADLLRRAMGKKNVQEMAQQRSVFVDAAVMRGVDRARAVHIFDLMEKFAGYGFNKSHSAAYALLTYQTAYLKAHFPAAFMAAVLTADMSRTDKVVYLIQECSCLGITVQPPDLNASVYEFAVGDERSIRYGLGAVRGVGEAAVSAIVAERGARGPFASLEDLCRRLDLQKVNRRVLEALIKCGSLDGIGANRAMLMRELGSAMQLGDQNARAHEAGQVDLFGLAAEAHKAAPRGASAPAEPDWSHAERLAGERETLGLYLTGHPIERVEPHLPHFVSHRIGDLIAERPTVIPGVRAFTGARQVRIAGLIDEIRRRGTRTSISLDDRSGRIEVTLFDEVLQRHRALIVKDALLLVEGQLRFDEFSDAWRLAARRLSDLDEALSAQARRIVVRWPTALAPKAFDELSQILTRYRPGPCPVTIEYRAPSASCALTLGAEWNVRPARELLMALEELAGHDGVELRCAPPTPPGGGADSLADAVRRP
jgi:DNA polymerase-3 subunit alpha